MQRKQKLIWAMENRCGEGSWEQLALEMGEAAPRHCSAVSALETVVTRGSAQGGY